MDDNYRDVRHYLESGTSTMPSFLPDRTLLLYLSSIFKTPNTVSYSIYVPIVLYVTVLRIVTLIRIQ